MSKAKVFVSLKMPQAAIEKLRGFADVVVNEKDRLLSRTEMIERLAGGYDALYCAIGDVIDEGVIEAAGEKCKIIANFGVGYNHIDVAAATRRGILVTNTPDVLTDATADLAWALLMAAARRVASSLDVRRRWKAEIKSCRSTTGIALT